MTQPYRVPGIAAENSLETVDEFLNRTSYEIETKWNELKGLEKEAFGQIEKLKGEKNLMGMILAMATITLIQSQLQGLANVQRILEQYRAKDE